MRRGIILALTLVALLGASLGDAQVGGGFSLRFHGNQSNDIDRVKIRIDAPEVPADVGATDFTIEWWMKALPGQNTAGAISPGSFNWVTGNILIDRDIWGSGENGDYGVSLGAERLAFGFGTTAGDNTIVGSRVIADGQWHHVAITRRRSDGFLQLYVDGALDASGDGPNGDGSYLNNRATSRPNDPFLVLGAEKHDVVLPGTAYRGWIDELRMSNVVRYTTAFTRPSAPFVTDGATVALYHFDEGSGTALSDQSGAAGGPSPAVRRAGGSPAGPEWSTDTPPFQTGPRAPAPPTNVRIVR
jgi:hypothetical protein